MVGFRVRNRVSKTLRLSNVRQGNVRGGNTQGGMSYTLEAAMVFEDVEI